MRELFLKHLDMMLVVVSVSNDGAYLVGMLIWEDFGCFERLFLNHCNLVEAQVMRAC